MILRKLRFMTYDCYNHYFVNFLRSILDIEKEQVHENQPPGFQPDNWDLHWGPDAIVHSNFSNIQ